MQKYNYEKIGPCARRVIEKRKAYNRKCLRVMFYLIIFAFWGMQITNVINKVNAYPNPGTTKYTMHTVPAKPTMHSNNIEYPEYTGFPYNNLKEAKAYQDEYMKAKAEAIKQNIPMDVFVKKWEKYQDARILANTKKLTKVSLGEYTITAYCPCEICCGEYAHTNYAVGSSGNRLLQGYSVASFLPAGTKIMLNNKVYTSEDTPADYIGKRYNNKVIDVYFETHEEAAAFGKQKQEVFLLLSEGAIDGNTI